MFWFVQVLFEVSSKVKDPKLSRMQEGVLRVSSFIIIKRSAHTPRMNAFFAAFLHRQQSVKGVAPIRDTSVNMQSGMSRVAPRTLLVAVARAYVVGMIQVMVLT